MFLLSRMANRVAGRTKNHGKKAVSCRRYLLTKFTINDLNRDLKSIWKKFHFFFTQIPETLIPCHPIKKLFFWGNLAYHLGDGDRPNDPSVRNRLHKHFPKNDLRLQDRDRSSRQSHWFPVEEPSGHHEDDGGAPCDRSKENFSRKSPGTWAAPSERKEGFNGPDRTPTTRRRPARPEGGNRRYRAFLRNQESTCSNPSFGRLV